MDKGAPIKVKDRVRGYVEINSGEVDDKILIKADGMPTYHFANVIDDHLMEITHVIREKNGYHLLLCIIDLVLLLKARVCIYH